MREMFPSQPHLRVLSESLREIMRFRWHVTRGRTAAVPAEAGDCNLQKGKWKLCSASDSCITPENPAHNGNDGKRRDMRHDFRVHGVNRSEWRETWITLKDVTSSSPFPHPIFLPPLGDKRGSENGRKGVSGATRGRLRVKR